MRTTRISTRVAIGLLMAAAGSAAAGSGGKYCVDPVESGLSTGATQEEALLAAVKWWSSIAGALGRGYESWDNADDQALECGKTKKGQFECKAIGRPCLPEGVLPGKAPKLDM
jgi:hypothetical protein